jgi:hypothetical protein
MLIPLRSTGSAETLPSPLEIWTENVVSVGSHYFNIPTIAIHLSAIAI